MCGRYMVFSQNDDSLMAKFLKQAGFIEPVSDICPAGAAPVILPEENKILSRCAYWGFPLSNSARYVINSCSETAGVKRFFADALFHRRCVIPASGFYEWSRETGQKYLFLPQNADILYMAGAYNVYGAFRRFVIFTRSADGDVSDVHNRMPVLMNENKVREYLLSVNYYEEAFIAAPPRLRRIVTS